jgi:flagellar basal body-associated protein FliL
MIMTRFLLLAWLLAVFMIAPLHLVFAEDAPGVKATAAPDSKDAPKKEDKKKKEEGEGGEAKRAPSDVSGGRFEGDPVYVHLSPMILPVITDNGAEQIVTLAVTIEVRDFDAADDVHTNMPKVMDALMRALYGGLGNGELREGQLINVSKVKAKAINAVGEAVGPEKIRDVLIEAVAQRRL